MCLCGNGVEDNEHFLLHCQRFSIHRTSYLNNVSHLIKRSTTTLSDSLLCNILLFGDNQFNDITSKFILGSTVDFCKKTGIFRCISWMFNGDWGLWQLFISLYSFLLSLSTFRHFLLVVVVVVSLKSYDSSKNTHSITVVTSWASNLACIAPSDFQMLAHVTLFKGVEIRGYATPVTGIYQL